MTDYAGSQQQQRGRRSAAPYAISGAVTHGGLIQITSAANPFLTGDTVSVQGVGGTVEANAKWTVTRISGTQFDLVGSTFTNAYTSGGTARRSQN